MSHQIAVTPIGPGTYRVDVGSDSHIVYVAGAANHRWVYWNGHVYERPFVRTEASARRRSDQHDAQALTSPMPATVRAVLVAPGATVRRNDTLIILEAMKMELPIRAHADGTVRSVHCAEGALVQAGTTLIEFES
jgi:biotin carboxyl carrier protein